MEIILAKNRLGYIGLNGKLPWRSTEDLQHFKKLTLGKKLLVGRTTYENMPELEDRKMIVIGEGYDTLLEGLAQRPDYIIGGKKLIESILNVPRYKALVEHVHLSIIDDVTVGDTKAPEFKEISITYYHFKTNK